MVWSVIIGVLLAGAQLSGTGTLEGAIREAIQRRVAAGGEVALVEAIAVPRLPAAVREARFVVEPLRPGRVKGRIVVMVDFAVSAARMRRVPVSCTVRTFAEAYVAAQMMDRHTSVAGADVVVREVETTMLPDDYLRNGAELKGMRTRQIIKEGTVLNAGMMEPEPVVHHGDPVVLTTVANNVRVSVSAVARQDGIPGSSIIVQPVGGHQRFRARVLDAKNVERVAE
jgi:flagella basal body P-ring formation protein FlgA